MNEDVNFYECTMLLGESKLGLYQIKNTKFCLISLTFDGNKISVPIDEKGLCLLEDMCRSTREFLR